MVYIPITDAEIEPEAPLTSILHHKLRDNPEAVFAGADGAPRLQSDAYGDNSIPGRAFNLSTATSSYNTFNTYYLNMVGGIYFWNFDIQTAGTAYFNDMLPVRQDSRTFPSRIHPLTFITGPTGQTSYIRVNYFVEPIVLLENSFLFILKNIVSDTIEQMSYLPAHPCYGTEKYIDHPFVLDDFTDYDIFLCKITPPIKRKIEIAMIPLVGGGFLTEDIILSSTPYDIDYFSNRRSFLESLSSIFTIDYTPLPWFTDENTILTPFAGISKEFPKIVSPEVANVVAVSLVAI